MAAPTFNKYRSTTIYGELKTRDFTNIAGTTVLEAASVDLSGNFLSRGDSTFTKAITCNGTITNGTHLATKNYVDSAVSGSSILGTANAWTNTNTYNNYFPTSTLPTSTSITSSSIVNKGMLDTIYQTISGMSSYLTTATASSTYQTISGMSSYLTTATASSTYQTISGMSSYLTTATAASTYSTLTNQVKTNIANAFTSTNTYNSYFPTSTLPTSTTITDDSIVNKGMNDTIYSSLGSDNTFTGNNYFDSLISQDGAPLATILNKLISTLFLEQVQVASIFKVNTTSNNSVMRCAEGDYPYILSGGSQVLYTTPQAFTIASQQTIAGSQITINQTTTTATNTANYSIANTIISNFTIPKNFSKSITLNIPISIRNAGTWTLSGSALSATITNTINSMTAGVYVNGTQYTLTGIPVDIQNSNSSTRSTTISYTTTGTKTIGLDQYFFNISINLDQFFGNTAITRNNSITNTLQIILSANITNTITRVSNTGNFTVNNTLTFVSNTGVSTISNTSTAGYSISYSPNSNGTGYAAATSIPYYNDTTNTDSGTTYVNHLRANSFNLLPAGMVVQWVTSTAPTGWLLCNGSTYNASSDPIYQELFNVIGNQFGGTNNTNFKVPDYRGMFLRGAGTNAQTGYTSYVGQTLNTQQTDCVQEHTHNTDLSTRRGTASDSANFVMSSNNVGGANTQTWTSSTQTTGRYSSVETRPVSYSVNYIIKY